MFMMHLICCPASQPTFYFVVLDTVSVKPLTAPLLTAETRQRGECSLLLTTEDVFVIYLVAFSVIPLCPEPSLLQPEWGPDCIEHTQASCQPHTGLREPEATDGVAQLQ